MVLFSVSLADSVVVSLYSVFAADDGSANRQSPSTGTQPAGKASHDELSEVYQRQDHSVAMETQVCVAVPQTGRRCGAVFTGQFHR